MVAIPLLLIGFGMAYTMPAATNVTVSAAGPAHAGLAAAILARSLLPARGRP
ncbi:hypothetical protein [Nocardia sp. NPDC051981]|uniref:hypothetical protein n=1 Tax=Nocardia sp. NPDC051981 TaxID=3155417 RepID=UPI0034122BDA